ncbi:hypothetical protein [Streptomyces sp. NPDC020298]
MELFWIGGASHYDLYDEPVYVSPALARPASFFAEQPDRPLVLGRAA